MSKNYNDANRINKIFFTTETLVVLQGVQGVLKKKR